ncbi:MAG: response regulator transcription factor, partial [Chloroflexi bacterium]|nr:response regulator transcription factor [Chloroflexota bacterium]
MTITESKKKIRVLLADDQSLMRRGISLLLQEEPDIEVVGEASNGWDVIENVKELEPDVVLMDVEMPGISGIDATRRILDAAPNVSVLIFTAYERGEFLFQALEAGASGFALKDANVYDLVSSIRTIHAGEISICPKMATKLVEEYLKRSASGGKESHDAYDRLSKRERQVLPLLAEGRNHHEIA